jgi:ABC-type glycerol-3-phosphate transport system permease component
MTDPMIIYVTIAIFIFWKFISITFLYCFVGLQNISATCRHSFTISIILPYLNHFRFFVLLPKWEKMTLPIGIRLLSGYMGTGSMSVVLAGITISLVMPVILYAFGQRYLIEGITLTGLKS